MSLLQVVITTVTAFKPEQSDSAADVVLALHFLRLFLSFGPAKMILAVPSLKPILRDNLLPEHQRELNEFVSHASNY